MPEQLLTNFKLLFQSMKWLSGWKNIFKHEKSKVIWRAVHLFWDVCSLSSHGFSLGVVIQPVHVILLGFHLNIFLNTNKSNKPPNQNPSFPKSEFKTKTPIWRISFWVIVVIWKSSVLKWKMSVDLLYRCCACFLCVQKQQTAKILTLAYV